MFRLSLTARKTLTSDAEARIPFTKKKFSD